MKFKTFLNGKKIQDKKALKRINHNIQKNKTGNEYTCMLHSEWLTHTCNGKQHLDGGYP